MEYASKGVAGAGLGLGIAGTALSLLNNGGSGLSGILGGGGDYVSRETFDLSLQLAKSQQDNAILSADLASEKKMVEIYNSLNDKINRVVGDQTAINAAQAVSNCGFTSAIAVANNNIMQLMGMTKLVIPSANVCTAGTTTSTGTTTT